MTWSASVTGIVAAIGKVLFTRGVDGLSAACAGVALTELVVWTAPGSVGRLAAPGVHAHDNMTRRIDPNLLIGGLMYANTRTCKSGCRAI